MTQEEELSGPESAPSDTVETHSDESGLGGTVEPPEEREPMPPVESRFMFVDIAALRAKQLRRGALPRVAAASGEIEADGSPASTQKLERIAMAELDKGLIVYDIPDPEAADADDAESEKSS